MNGDHSVICANQMKLSNTTEKETSSQTTWIWSQKFKVTLTLEIKYFGLCYGKSVKEMENCTMLGACTNFGFIQACIDHPSINSDTINVPLFMYSLIQPPVSEIMKPLILLMWFFISSCATINFYPCFLNIKDY
jgi:hypothetical protein